MTQRECLPSRRSLWTQRVRVQGQTLHLGFGEYPDGRLAELWIDASKEGTFLRDSLHALAMSISLGLQHGIPVEEFVDVMLGTDSEPKGVVETLEGRFEIESCTSVFDLLAQLMKLAYVPEALTELVSPGVNGEAQAGQS